MSVFETSVERRRFKLVRRSRLKSVHWRIYISEKDLMRTLKIGTKMGGYQLLGLIARGGMGAVYEALEVALERKVALKVIAPPNPDDHDSEELVQRFMQEARTLARVNHPSVITIYAIDTFEGVPFITMELVEGISFKELLSVSFLSADLATPMFIQMLEGLQCLHSNRIVHRDLKPHNVMVRKDGQIKILDFGIAKPSDSGNFTHVGVVVGSLAYMAPEVKLGIAATERSDLWNLGAIFYECLTGKSLPKALADSGGKDIPYAANSPIPLEIRAVIGRLCAQRPLDRYENCEQAIEELKSFQRKRAPVTPDVMHAFSRKVEEIVAKRRNDSRDIPAADITPVQAAVLPGDAPATIVEFRERPYTPRERRKKRRFNPLHAVVGAMAALLLLVFLLKPKFDAQRSVPAAAPATQAPAPVKHEEPKPLQFKPPEPIEEPLALSSPKAEEVVTVEPGAVPTLSWSQELKRGAYGLQISTDRAFRKILLDEEVSGSSFRPPRLMPEGHYYWRLMPKTAAGEPVGPLRFTLSHPAPVALISPEESQQFEYSAKEKGVAVSFKWECRPGVENYQIQIAAGPKFVSREETTTDCAYREGALPAGVYRWRARGFNKTWSDSREFTVSKKIPTPVKAPAPVMAKPELSGDIKLGLQFAGSPRDLASATKAIAEFPMLKWSNVKGARKYVVQISDGKDFAQTMVDETVTETSFEWKAVEPGQYFWRVAAVADKAGPFSSPARLEISLPAPKLKAKYKFETLLEGERQVINWPFVPMASKYLVQFGAKRDLASLEPQVISSSKFPLPKKQGQFFIRVAAANENGQALGPYSNVTPVSVEPVASLDTPAVKFPKLGAATVSRGGRLSIAFEWSKIARAERYVIEISRDEDFAEILEKISSVENSHVMKKLDAFGRIYWRVRAESRDGVSSWSDPSYFEVRK